MGNITTNNARKSKGWYLDLLEDAEKHRNDSPYTRERWARWDKRCKYMNEVRANWKHEPELLPRLRRLQEEDLGELGGLIDLYCSFPETCSQECLEKFPALELYFLVKRDMRNRLKGQYPPSECSCDQIELKKTEPGSLQMLRELEAWLYSPGDSITEFKRRLRLWAEALDMHEREMDRACACVLAQIAL